MSAVPSSASYCAVCGEPRISGAKFCGRCGATFQTAPRSVTRAGVSGRTGGATDLVYIAIAAVLAIGISHLPIVDTVIYPFRLFGTFVHEWCHAIVAISTGGRVDGLQINSDLTGETRTAGGWLLPIFSAGYVGAACVGAVLLVLPTRWARQVLICVGSLSILMPLVGGIAFGTNFTSTTWLWTAIFSSVTLLVGLRAPARVAGLFQQFLAVMLCFTTLDSLRQLAWITENSGAVQKNALGQCFYGQSAGIGSGTDALNAQCYYSLPAMFWTVLWFAIAVAVIGFAAYRVVRRSFA